MRCNSAGQVHFTYKFLLARAKNLIIVNANFLAEWSKTDEMPKLAAFSVCLPEDFSSVPKLLPPLADERMFHNLAFTLDHNYNMLFTFEQMKVAVEALGGVFWEQEQKDISKGKMPTRTCFNIGGTYEPGKGIVSSEWITDMVVWGRRLHHKGFEVKEGSEDAGEEELYTQPVKKAKVCLGSYVWSQLNPTFAVLRLVPQRASPRQPGPAAQHALHVPAPEQPLHPPGGGGVGGTHARHHVPPAPRHVPPPLRHVPAPRHVPAVPAQPVPAHAALLTNIYT